MIRYSAHCAAMALMRRTLLLLTVATMLAAPAAAEDLGDKLVGSWRLVSLKISYVGENTGQDVLGTDPIGRIIYSADRHFAVFIARNDRKPPQNETDRAALVRSMAAYTGTFQIEGDQATYTVDGAWNESFPKQQIRILRLDGDTLTATSPEPQASTFSPGKRFTTFAVFRRERAP
ncbi:MAG: lipocalin-like domain-containing protein [Alphaproteobacteria bacterium]|nr:lipocalin-like domain-containing protein [Alphaproteobacteria bacterium]